MTNPADSTRMPAPSLQGSSQVSFADVAHQTLSFDRSEPAEALILRLIDTRWMQRLRRISQTGNTRFVYMFAEHSRFGHSLGVAYLATMLMKQLRRHSDGKIAAELARYEAAVAAAAILHDVGHIAPGSHLAERCWAPKSRSRHETVSSRVIREDEEITSILSAHSADLQELVCRILAEDAALPKWTVQIISGGGWNADRGNWAIVDSAMCAVSYGRYNVNALVDAFRIAGQGELVLHESRLDALTHFFVARDSMYRQVYQHRVLQAVDALSQNIIQRLRDLTASERRAGSTAERAVAVSAQLERKGVFADDAMAAAIVAEEYATELPLETIFRMTESWWGYHIERWTACGDPVLADLAARMRDRRLLKTVRLNGARGTAPAPDAAESEAALVARAAELAAELGLDPRYYVTVVADSDKHRGKAEQPPMVLLENGSLVTVQEVEPMLGAIIGNSSLSRRWLAVPRAVKERLGRER